MAAEICLSQLPLLVEDPNAEFQVCFLISFAIFLFFDASCMRCSLNHMTTALYRRIYFMSTLFYICVWISCPLVFILLT